MKYKNLSEVKKAFKNKELLFSNGNILKINTYTSEAFIMDEDNNLAVYYEEPLINLLTQALDLLEIPWWTLSK